MSEVKRYEISGKFESTGDEGIFLTNPKMVLEEDFDAQCHATGVYFESWKNTEQERDTERLRAETAEAELAALREELAEQERNWTARFELICEGAIRPIALERNAAREALTAAEQRNSELVELLKRVDMTPLDSWYSSGLNVEVFKAIQPTESAKDNCTCWRQPQEPQCTDCPNNKPTESGESE